MIFFWVFESTNSGLYLDQWRWLKQRPRRVVVECDGFEQWLLSSLFVAIYDLRHILKLISNIQTKHEDSTQKKTKHEDPSLVIRLGDVAACVSKSNGDFFIQTLNFNLRHSL